MKQITIIIEPNGEVDADAQGFKGGECVKKMNELLDSLGSGTVKKKPEYNQNVANRQNVGGR